MSEYIGFWMFPVLLIFLLGGFPIALSMICTAFIFGVMQFGASASFQLISQIDSVAGNSVLAAVPLFVFMGAFLEKAVLHPSCLRLSISGHGDFPAAWLLAPLSWVPSLLPSAEW